MRVIGAILLGFAIASLTACTSDYDWEESGHSLGSTYPDDPHDAAFEQQFDSAQEAMAENQQNQQMAASHKGY